LPPNGISAGATGTLHPKLVFSCIGSVTQWSWAKLCGVQQRVPPIFGRDASPRSGYLLFSLTWSWRQW